MATCYISRQHTNNQCKQQPSEKMKGYTKIIADMIAEETKGTLFHIKTETRKTRKDGGGWIIA